MVLKEEWGRISKFSVVTLLLVESWYDQQCEVIIIPCYSSFPVT